MPYVYSIVTVRVVWLIAGGLAMLVLLVLWISTLLSRRWFVTIKRSEETEVISFHIRRIADAVERLSTAREMQPPMDTAAGKAVGMSAFGR